MDQQQQNDGGVAVKDAPKTNPPKPLKPWKVLLHNDDKNHAEHVVGAIQEIVKMNRQDAELRMLEAHETGVALLVMTHKERAELYVDQFHSKRLAVSIEEAD